MYSSLDSRPMSRIVAFGRTTSATDCFGFGNSGCPKKKEPSVVGRKLGEQLLKRIHDPTRYPARRVSRETGSAVAAGAFCVRTFGLRGGRLERSIGSRATEQNHCDETAGQARSNSHGNHNLKGRESWNKGIGPFLIGAWDTNRTIAIANLHLAVDPRLQGA